MDRQEMAQLIKDNFSDIQLLKSEDIFIPSANHIFDVARAENEIRGNQQWWEIPLSILMDNRDRISYLSIGGFRFLLPAFLVAALEQSKRVDVLRDNIIDSLIPPKSSDVATYEIFETRMRVFSTRQSQAVATFFQEYITLFPVTEWSFTENDKVQINLAYIFWTAKARHTK